ncbi:hypothetical protein [Phaeodactylibacter xiamenensis]|uniref:hypothetical protein n=1 Tax=Phaeodactylibacter xiamenensis TaxID=1524460 RepID=UPI003BAAD5D1
MRYLLLYLFAGWLCLPSLAQPYVSGGKTRHRFAQLLIGADAMYLPASGQTFALDGDGSLSDFTPTAALVPRINIAGTHFWGHANFYISIPVANVLDSSVPFGGDYTFNPGVETGLRVYPWRIEEKKLRPFAGAAFAISDWQQNSNRGSGAFAHQTRFPVQLGLTWQRKQLLFELGAGQFLNNQTDYYVSPNDAVEIELPSTYFWLGCNWQIETTLSAEKSWKSGQTAATVERLEEKRALSGWSVAVGPSSAFILGRSPRNDKLYPAIGRHSGAAIFPEFGLGYYHYPWDAHLNLAFRANRSERSAYGTAQVLQRRALTLEAYKFLFDYHGFVPFIGPHLSREWLSMEETVQRSTPYEGSEVQWVPGVTFGWDIRPNQLQGFILRTNLRYTPTQNIGPEGGVSFRQLEFNFIQLVLYPGRIKRMQRALR